MEVLNNVSATYDDESVKPAPTADLPSTHFLTPNSQNSFELTTINTEIENSDYHSNIYSPRGRPAHIAISITPADQTTPQVFNLSLHPAQYLNCTGILYLIYAATLLVMFPSTIALVDLKYQNNALSIFETHGVFANTGVVAYITAIPTSVALFFLKSLNNESLRPIYIRMLLSVFYFSSLLAPLSFLLVLFLPRGFNLIGYLLVFTFFLVIVACSFGDYICKKDAPLASTMIEE